MSSDSDPPTTPAGTGGRLTVSTAGGSSCHRLRTTDRGGSCFGASGFIPPPSRLSSARAQINLIETCLTVATNLLSPLAGILIDRWSIRHHDDRHGGDGVWAFDPESGRHPASHLGGVGQLIPLDVLLIGAIPSAALVSRWFIRRRGLALGLTATGSSMGGFLGPPLMTWLFLEWDWRTGLMVGGCICFMVIRFLPLVARNEPADLGLSGEPDAPASRRLYDTPAFSADAKTGASRPLRSQIFWLQMVVSGTLLAVTLGMLATSVACEGSWLRDTALLTPSSRSAPSAAKRFWPLDGSTRYSAVRLSDLRLSQ